jgi:hypothetical protein
VLKRTAIGLMSLLWFITSCPIKSLADDLFIYPTKNQSAEQQDKDKWNAVLGRPSRPGSIPRRARPLQLHPLRVRRREVVCCGAPRVVRRSAQLAGLLRERPEREPRSARPEEDCSV